MALKVGLSRASGMGAAPLSAVEIVAWCEGVGADLSSLEFEWLMDMSRSYVAGTTDDTAPVDPERVQSGLLGAKLSIDFSTIQK